MDPHDLDAALEAARGADEAAITCLFRAFQPQLLRYLRQRAPGVAEDLASETWLAAARGLLGFEGDASDFRAWLFTVARRRVVDYYRSEARHLPTVELEGNDPVAAGSLSDAVIDALSSEAALAKLVDDLTPDQAEVVLLRVVADLSVNQVAAVMHRSPGSVRVLQHRALRHLARVWSLDDVTQ